MPSSDFLRRDLPVVKKRVHRLGLSFNHGIDARGVEAALHAGMNYLFWSKLGKGEQHAAVKAALAKDREKIVRAVTRQSRSSPGRTPLSRGE